VSCSVFHYENHALMFITGAAFIRRAFAVNSGTAVNQNPDEPDGKPKRDK